MMKKILIIDDSATLRRLMKYTISRVVKGLVYFEASNGIEGLEKLRQLNPDIIVLDINMPKMNGVDFLKEKNNDDSYKGIPVIILTNEENLFDKIDLQKFDNVYFLPKPFNVSKMKEILVKISEGLKSEKK